MVTVHQAFLFDISANLINALVAERTEVPTAILQKSNGKCYNSGGESI